jgi:excisionase family DNA binding protein
MKKVMTTGEVANLFSVSARTISKWGDSGKLKQWKVNNDRRFNTSDVVKFAIDNGMESLVSDLHIVEPTKSSSSKDFHKDYLNLLSKIKSLINTGKFCLEDKTYKISIDNKNDVIQSIELMEKTIQKYN